VPTTFDHTFHAASAASVAAFLGVCALVLGLFLRGIWLGARSQRRDPARWTLYFVGGLVLWLGMAAGLVSTGWTEAVPVHLLIAGTTVMLGSVILGLSPVGRWMALACPAAWLLAFQGFRLPLELVLHSWVHQGVIPQTMTWTGSNWDIVSGIAALVFAPFCKRSRAAAWLGNIIGFALLLNVGRVAILSAPVPFGWTNVSPRLLLPFHLPYALIVPVCVGGALAGHVILTRALLLRSR
jgi:hypothetical protein